MKTRHNLLWFELLERFLIHLEEMNEDCYEEMIPKWIERNELIDEIKRRTDELDKDEGMRFVSNLMKLQLETRTKKADELENGSEMKQLKVE